MNLRIVMGVVAAALALGAPASAQPPGALAVVSAQVSEAELRATIERLVSFGTRHTLSDTRSETRGIGAARRWTQARFQAISRDCGGCLTIATPSAVVTGARIPTPTEVVNVLAIQRGTSDAERVLIISAHLDTRVNDVMDAVSEAPGANDDGSGVAAVIEAARLLSRQRYPATIVYAVLSGEEQSLYGGQILADYAKAQNWQVEAVLNNDIIGNTEGIGGARDNMTVRVFSEGVRAAETPAQAAARRSNGGEVDSPSRNLARFIDRLAEQQMTDLDVRLIYRTDRFSRGGDQVRMLEAGYPAIRFTESVEHYDRQHQSLRTENGRRYGDTIDGVDFHYLAKVTRLNVMTLAALAAAPRPPLEVRIEGALGSNTQVSWTAVPGAAGYNVWWRSTTEPQWTHSRRAGADATSLVLRDVVIDDWFFGVSTVGAGGYESPVQFAGPLGAFFPTPPPTTAPTQAR